MNKYQAFLCVDPGKMPPVERMREKGAGKLTQAEYEQQVRQWTDVALRKGIDPKTKQQEFANFMQGVKYPR